MSIDTFRQRFSGKKILIFGFGILGGGKGTLSIFQHFPCQIVITDRKTEADLADSLHDIENKQIHHMTLGKHLREDIDWADVIVKNPAVPSSNEFIQYAITQGKYITTDAALYLKFSEANTIGITGTRGKTTTTLLTHHIVSHTSNAQVLLGGNIKDIGSLPLLLEEKTNAISIVELSSFALEGCHWEKVSPKIAAITNIYADHLDRYVNIRQYANEKAAIFMYQREHDHVFLNRENEWTTDLVAKVHSHLHLVEKNTAGVEALQLKGDHNQWNAAFAISIATTLGLDITEIKKHVATFQGAPFRQEKVGESHGITFINDSTATTPEAVIVALQAFPHANFIIGGTTKQLDQTELAKKLDQFAGNIFLLRGSGTEELVEAMQRKCLVFDSLQAAFQEAVKGNPSEVVFSPGFTSFELFKNEFDRADQFNRLVKEF